MAAGKSGCMRLFEGNRLSQGNCWLMPELCSATTGLLYSSSQLVSTITSRTIQTRRKDAIPASLRVAIDDATCG